MIAARIRKTMRFLGGVLIPVLLLTLMGPVFLTGRAGVRSALHAQDFPDEGTGAPAGGADDGSEAPAPGDQGQTGSGESATAPGTMDFEYYTLSSRFLGTV